MHPAVREELDRIDAFFASRMPPNQSVQQWEECTQLWKILTAMRGPDNGDTALKDATTAVIRTAALPRTAVLARHYSCVAIFANPAGTFDGGDEVYDHFYSHARDAARHLGLLP